MSFIKESFKINYNGTNGYVMYSKLTDGSMIRSFMKNNALTHEPIELAEYAMAFVFQSLRRLE